MQTIEYSGIFLSYFSDEDTTCIPAAKEHYLTFVYSGELEFEFDGKQIFTHGGECVFLRRNHKLKFHKRSFDGKPYKDLHRIESQQLEKILLRTKWEKTTPKCFPIRD